MAGALGLGPDEPVSLNAMARIRSLNVRGAGVADLTGLEQAVNLEALDLGRNGFGSIRSAFALRREQVHVSDPEIGQTEVEKIEQRITTAFAQN